MAKKNNPITWEIRDARSWDDGSVTWEIRDARSWDDGSVSFSIDFFAAEDRPITVYNCRIVEGKDGNFISFPSRKGKDGKFYSFAYIRLTDAEQDEIIEEVTKTLSVKRKARK